MSNDNELSKALAQRSVLFTRGAVTVERDFVGTVHIRQGDFDAIQLPYDRRYTDNASQRLRAERIVGLLLEPMPAQPPRPAAVVDEGDEGQWADILPDVSVKVGQHLYADPPAPAAALDVMQFQLKHPVNGETRTVEFTRAEIAALVESEIFEKLADQLCECGGPVGETNHVDHNCDEYADEFELIAAPLDGKGGR